MTATMTFLVALALAVLALGSNALGQQRSGRFETEITIKIRMNYLLFKPRAAGKGKLPMLVFLHGSGERGDDLERVKTHGPPKIVEKDKDFPFIVLSPQCEKNSWWRPQAIANLVDEITGKHPVDPDRIYLTGLSMGGYGTWDTAARYPHKFAAIVPICGGGDPATAAAIKHLPVWVFHGAKDANVPLANSERMVQALRRQGSKVRFTVYPEAKHNSWGRAYRTQELYDWLLEQRRRPTGR